jgi:hypothetical protein
MLYLKAETFKELFNIYYITEYTKKQASLTAQHLWAIYLNQRRPTFLI